MDELNGIPELVADRFEIGERASGRPNCSVYSAKDRQLGLREVVVKFFMDRPSGNVKFIESFESQVAMLRRASHPVLVPILAGGCQDDWFYIAMERIEGTTLRDVLKGRQEPLSQSAVQTILEQLVSALSELHSEGVVHGHIDSRAVFLKGEDVRLAGYYPPIIAEIQKNQTTAGRLVIDPTYIAPEQISQGSAVDNRCDVYALAVLTYEMICGKRPFEGTNPLQVAMQRLLGDPLPPSRVYPAVSPLVEASIMKGLAKSQEERFATVEEFFDAFVGGKPTSKNPLAKTPERITTETIAVSMSTESIKDLLAKHSSSHPAPSGQSDGGGSGDEEGGTVSAKVGELQSGSEGVMATQASISTQSVLRPALVFLTGPERGRKVVMNKDRLLVGKDPSLDVVVDDAKAPSRALMLLWKDGATVASPLASQGLVVNGKQVESEEGVSLKRGDELTVGSQTLRYIAAGEVFTLQEDAADRTIDRAKSKMPVYLGGLAAVLVLLVVYFVLEYQDQVQTSSQKKAIAKAKEEAEREELVARLMREGDELLKVGKLSEPVGDNALERFGQVLELSPDHSYAKRRIAEIRSRLEAQESQEERKARLESKVASLLTDAERYLAKGALVAPGGSNARDVFEEVLKLQPDNQQAREGLERIQRLIGDIVSQVAVFQARAEVYRDLGQYIAPEGENVSDLVKRILQIDPENTQAVDLLYEVAATSIHEGDLAKSKGDLEAMESAFLTAEVLGVNRTYLQDRRKGAETLKMAQKSSLVIYSRPEDVESKKEYVVLEGELKLDLLERALRKIELQNRMSDINSDGSIGQQGGRLVEVPAN